MKTGKDFLSADGTGLISYYDDYLKSNNGCDDNGDMKASCKSGFQTATQCSVSDVTQSLLSDIGTTPGTGTAIALFPNGCASKEISTDAQALGKFVSLGQSDPKIQELVKVNEETQCACLKVKMDLGVPLSSDEQAAKDALSQNGKCLKDFSTSSAVPIIQSLNAATVAITQNVGYNMAAFEGFNACQKIQALRTLSQIIDASLQVVKHQTP